MLYIDFIEKRIIGTCKVKDIKKYGFVTCFLGENLKSEV